MATHEHILHTRAGLCFAAMQLGDSSKNAHFGPTSAHSVAGMQRADAAHCDGVLRRGSRALGAIRRRCLGGAARRVVCGRGAAGLWRLGFSICGCAVWRRLPPAVCAGGRRIVFLVCGLQRVDGLFEQSFEGTRQVEAAVGLTIMRCCANSKQHPAIAQQTNLQVLRARRPG